MDQYWSADALSEMFFPNKLGEPSVKHPNFLITRMMPRMPATQSIDGWMEETLLPLRQDAASPAPQ